MEVLLATAIKTILERIRQNVPAFARKPISEQQKRSLTREPQPTVNSSIYQVTFALIQDEAGGLREVLRYALESLRKRENVSTSIPSTIDLDVEWVISREHSQDSNGLSEKMLETNLKQRNCSTILYIYGGIFL